MAEKGLLITKFPYLSYAKNIIECFSIIGYEEKHLQEIINEYKITKEQNYSPVIISSIISNEDFGIIDNDFIINQIFPDNPKFILKSKINPSNEEPKSKSIIFTLITDSQDSPGTEKKIFYNCFAFVFYETYTYENNSVSEEYFIPKTFCIISQYSFFGLFKHICLNLYNLFLKNSTISNYKLPLEIIIYNIVNFTPSPIKHNINYILFKDILDVPSYYIHQLSGYPLLDFNVFDIFNILPVRFFIEIYLYTVLEQSILFFSSNLEILNLVMFIFYSFNYPCNNSTYFWHIVSISNKDLNEENRFVGQIMSSMLGVNCEYDESIDTSAFGYYHFIVDIDNKKLILKANNNSNDDDKKIFSLYNYIHNIIDEKEVQSVFLKKYIDRLIKLVDNIFKDIDFDNTKGKGIDFFGRINRVKNNNIQEYFYNFIINLLLVIYQNTNLDFSISNIKIQLNKKLYFKKNNESLLIKDEEKLFCKFFKNTSKYKIFFENFLTKYESDKLYKIPLLFCEEFVNLKIKSNQNRIPLKLPYFYCMNNLYTLSSTQVKMLELYHFSFKYSNDELKIELMKVDPKRESISNPKNKSLFNLNKKVLENYIYILKNSLSKEKLISYFPAINIINEKINYINSKNIVEKIQNFFEKNNYITSSNYLIYSSIYIFSILIPLFSYENILFYLDKLSTCFMKVDFFLRYYINIILQTFYKYYLINEDKHNFPNMTYDNIQVYFFLLFSILKDQKILPNEEMILIKNALDSKNKTKKNSFDSNEPNIKKELNENTKKNELDLSNDNFIVYMKYNFDSNKSYQTNTILNIAMKELNECNIKANISDSSCKNNVVIIAKIKDTQNSAEFFSPKKVYEEIKKEFKNYERNFSLKKISFKVIKDILINLIQYSNELKGLKILRELFINGLYLFDKFKENEN